MWGNSLKNVESDNNKILYETLLNFFLQRNSTYFLNKPRSITNITQGSILKQLVSLDTGFLENNTGACHIKEICCIDVQRFKVHEQSDSRFSSKDI